MKRWLSILAVFGCIVALSGCKNENEKRQAYFNAKVLEINKEYVDVSCLESLLHFHLKDRLHKPFLSAMDHFPLHHH